MSLPELPKTMKAIQIQQQGAARCLFGNSEKLTSHPQGGIDELKLTDIPLPEYKDTEVLIKTEWSGVK